MANAISSGSNFHPPPTRVQTHQFFPPDLDPEGRASGRAFVRSFETWHPGPSFRPHRGPAQEGDVYPTGVRELKTELLNTLLGS